MSMVHSRRRRTDQPEEEDDGKDAAGDEGNVDPLTMSGKEDLIGRASLQLL